MITSQWVPKNFFSMFSSALAATQSKLLDYTVCLLACLYNYYSFRTRKNILQFSAQLSLTNFFLGMGWANRKLFSFSLTVFAVLVHVSWEFSSRQKRKMAKLCILKCFIRIQNLIFLPFSCFDSYSTKWELTVVLVAVIIIIFYFCILSC